MANYVMYLSTICCRYCQGEHNSLLRVGKFAPSQDHLNKPASTSAASKSEEMAQVTNMMTPITGIVLLATARIRLTSKIGESFSVRLCFGNLCHSKIVQQLRDERPM